MPSLVFTSLERVCDLRLSGTILSIQFSFIFYSETNQEHCVFLWKLLTIPHLHFWSKKNPFSIREYLSGFNNILTNNLLIKISTNQGLSFHSFYFHFYAFVKLFILKLRRFQLKGSLHSALELWAVFLRHLCPIST